MKLNKIMEKILKGWVSVKTSRLVVRRRERERERERGKEESNDDRAKKRQAREGKSAGKRVWVDG
jgi:hypothetical protein